MSKIANLYIGRAGQMAVMAEFLMRGYNVAIPEVDVGDDILVVRDSDGEYARIQVKTTRVTKTGKGYSARYSLKLRQLESPSAPETWYVFANRLLDKWASFIIISREDLYYFYQTRQVGSVNKGGVLSLYFAYTDDAVICSGQDFSHHLNNWGSWPPVEH